MSLMSGFPQNNYHHPLLHHHHHHHHAGMVYSSGVTNDATPSVGVKYSAYYPSTDSSAESPPYYWPPAAAATTMDASPVAQSTVIRGDFSTAAVYDANSTANPNATTTDMLQAATEFIPGRGNKRRNTANRKERRRTLSINTAFSDLRDCIPNVPSDTKLSKIKTLRLATSYIAYLMDILAKDDPNSILEGGGFKADVCKKMESRDERKKKEMANLLGPSGGVVIGGEQKKAKGRTGWPQHVWALELKQ